MKKFYIAPETNVYKVNALSSMMVATSFGVVGDDTPINEGDFTDGSRDNGTDDNTNNRSNVWDNIW